MPPWPLPFGSLPGVWRVGGGARTRFGDGSPATGSSFCRSTGHWGYEGRSQRLRCVSVAGVGRAGVCGLAAPVLAGLRWSSGDWQGPARHRHHPHHRLSSGQQQVQSPHLFLHSLRTPVTPQCCGWPYSPAGVTGQHRMTQGEDCFKHLFISTTVEHTHVSKTQNVISWT